VEVEFTSLTHATSLEEISVVERETPFPFLTVSLEKHLFAAKWLPQEHYYIHIYE
jgi:hypothetical protein